jgi:quinol monooxygenase YgiN
VEFVVNRQKQKRMVTKMTEHWEDGDYYEQAGAYEDEISPDYSDFLYDQWKDEQAIKEYKRIKSGTDLDCYEAEEIK